MTLGLPTDKRPDEWGSREIAMVTRELERAHMIAKTPEGVWPDSLMALARRILREWAGWNVTPLPRRASAASPCGRSSPASFSAGAPILTHEVFAALEAEARRKALIRAQFDAESI